MGADGVEAGFYVFVATVDLVDVVDFAGSFGTHGSDEHGYTGADIGAGHVVMLELARVVMAYYDCSVRIAEDYLCAHINEFVHEEEAGFEHLLVNEDRTACLRGYHKDD